MSEQIEVWDNSGGTRSLERVQMILIGGMLLFEWVAIYFTQAGLMSGSERRLFFSVLLAVLFLGLAECIVGYINSFKAMRNPLSIECGWHKRQWTYTFTVLAIMLGVAFTPSLAHRNTVKAWERMEREEFNHRKNNPPRYQPLESHSFAWESDGDFRNCAS